MRLLLTPIYDAITMKKSMKIAALLLLAVVVVALRTSDQLAPQSGNSSTKLSDYNHTQPYVVLADYTDAKGHQKLYMANNVLDSYEDMEDFFDTTYLIVFNVQTKKKDTLRTFESLSFPQMGFIDFYHFEKGKLYFTETGYRAGSSLSYVDVRTDRVKVVVEGGIPTDDEGVSKVHVKGGKLYYSKLICINEDEARYEADKEYVEREYSIQM